MPKSQLMIGVDLGGTNVRAGLVDNESRIVKHAKATIGDDTRFESVIDKAVRVIREVLPDGGLDAVSTIGIGSPGPLNRETGVIIETRNLNWDNVPLTSAISKKLGGKPIWLENDAHAHAWGEFQAGAGRDADDMIMLTLGTGVGGAIIYNGKLLLGKDGAVGHIGAMPIDMDHPQIQHFQGTVESLCSAHGIVRNTVRLLTNDMSTPSALRSEPLSGITARDVYAAARAGDVIATNALAQTGTYLGVACAGLVNIMNTERIVIGGGAAAAWDFFYPALIAEMKTRAWPTMFSRARVVPAELGDDAGIIGAAGLAMLH